MQLIIDNFVSQSSRMYALLLPVLYSSVDLRTSKTCRVTLNNLVECPAVTRCIRRLVVRPNHCNWPEDDEWIDETSVVNAIVKMANAGNLQAMNTFFWDGSEMPDDHLWSILRTRHFISSRLAWLSVDKRSGVPNYELLAVMLVQSP